MKYNTKIKLFIAFLVGGAVLYSFFRTSIRDTLFLWNRPWAYSSDKNTKLFVGTWEGNFIDPNGISKQIELTIYKPTADNKGKRTFFKEVYRNKRSFDGKAIIKSKIGTENYEIWGHFDQDNPQNFTFEVRTQENLSTPNFYFQGAKNGKWKDDEINFVTGFNFRRADGSSYWSSSEPIYDYKATISLKRKAEN